LQVRILLILTLLNLWYVNNRVLIISPSTYEAKRPSEWLSDNPQIVKLMGKEGKVSGLDFPFYCGHWVHIKTLGYTGGFRDKSMDFLGEGGNTWNGSLKKAEEYGIKYFIKEGKIWRLQQSSLIPN
jgi:hypothetical protein